MDIGQKQVNMLLFRQRYGERGINKIVLRLQ